MSSIVTRKHIKGAQHGMFARKLGSRQNCVMRIQQGKGSTPTLKPKQGKEPRTLSGSSIKPDSLVTTRPQSSPAVNRNSVLLMVALILTINAKSRQ